MSVLVDKVLVYLPVSLVTWSLFGACLHLGYARISLTSLSDAWIFSPSLGDAWIFPLSLLLSPEKTAELEAAWNLFLVDVLL